MLFTIFSPGEAATTCLKPNLSMKGKYETDVVSILHIKYNSVKLGIGNLDAMQCV